jgi:hypothetical protein
MEYPKITHLYKYYAYNCNSLSVLINKKVRFSKPASLDDPFDTGLDFVSYASSEDFDYMNKVVQNKLGVSKERKKEFCEIVALEKCNPDPRARNEAWAEALKKCREDLQNSGVFCLTELNNNILMWSQYADHHKGFCVEFSRTPQNCLGDIDKTNPVIYSCAYPTLSPFSDRGMSESFDLLLTKFIEWKYEAEWRLINDVGDIELPLPGDISAIIFGLKMPLEHRKRIKNILSNNPEIVCKKAEKVQNQFRLEIVDCEPDDSLYADE